MRSKAEKLPRVTRYYIAGVATLGLGLAVVSLAWSLAFSQFNEWLYFLIAVLLGGLMPIRLPHARNAAPWILITLNDLFIYACLLFFAPSVATILGAVDGLVSGAVVHHSTRVSRAFFHGGRGAIVYFVVGNLFYRLMGDRPPLDLGHDLLTVFVNVGFCALVGFLLNSILLGLAVRLTSTVPIREWGHNLILSALPSIVAAMTAGGMFVSLGRSDVYALAVAAPTGLLIYAVFRINKERNKSIRRFAEQMDALYQATISSLAMAIDAKDQSSHGHIYRVQSLSLELARIVGMTDEAELQGLRAAAVLHDIGKLAVPEYILNKPAPLTESEMLKMKAHPSLGAEILNTVPYPYPVVPYVRHHHEKWNGTGYPQGLSGEAIPRGARILAVADSYDALRSDRPYRPALSRESALDYIRAERAKAYDPTIVDALLTNIDQLESAMHESERQVPANIVRELEQRFPDQQEKARTIFEDISSTYREVQTIYEISEIVGKSLSISEVLDLLIAKFRELIDCDAACIYLLRADQSHLLCQRCFGVHAEALENRSLRVGDGVTGWVAANNQALVNAMPAPDFPEASGPFLQLKSCLSVPLSIDDRVIGVATLYSKTQTAFHQEHLRLLEATAHHAAIAINNAVMFEETQEDAYTDLITGLPNLRYFQSFIDQELRRATRIDYPVTILMMDLELFKNINDKHGHKVGDRVLAGVASVLRSQMRRSDTCVRYAGDEFLAVLPGTRKDQAQQTTERIQAAVDAFRLQVRNQESVQVGISVGAASFPEDGQDLEHLLAVADAAMYADKAKRAEKRRRSGGDVVPFEKR